MCNNPVCPDVTCYMLHMPQESLLGAAELANRRLATLYRGAQPRTNWLLCFGNRHTNRKACLYP